MPDNYEKSQKQQTEDFEDDVEEGEDKEQSSPEMEGEEREEQSSTEMEEEAEENEGGKPRTAPEDQEAPTGDFDEDEAVERGAD